MTEAAHRLKKADQAVQERAKAHDHASMVLEATKKLHEQKQNDYDQAQNDFDNAVKELVDAILAAGNARDKYEEAKRDTESLRNILKKALYLLNMCADTAREYATEITFSK